MARSLREAGEASGGASLATSFYAVRVEFHTSFNPVYKFPHRLPQMFLSRVTLDSFQLTVSVSHLKGKCSIFFFSVKIKNYRKKYTLDYVLEKI